jgi:hypothetical protein
MFSEKTTERALAIDNLRLEQLAHNGKQLDHYAVTDGQDVYGVVSKRYQPVTHKRALANVQEFLPEGKVINTYAEDGLSRVVFNIELPKVYDLGGEEIRTFIALRNSLDGRWKLGIIVSPVQVICRNTFVLSFKKAYIDISAKHTKTAVQKFFSEVPLVSQVYAALEGQLSIAQDLIAKPASTDAGKAFLKELVEKRIIGKKVGDAAALLYEKPQFKNEEQRNYFGLFNTLTNVLSRDLEEKESIGAFEKILTVGEVFAEVAR